MLCPPGTMSMSIPRTISMPSMSMSPQGLFHEMPQSVADSEELEIISQFSQSMEADICRISVSPASLDADLHRCSDERTKQPPMCPSSQSAEDSRLADCNPLEFGPLDYTRELSAADNSCSDTGQDRLSRSLQDDLYRCTYESPAASRSAPNQCNFTVHQASTPMMVH